MLGSTCEETLPDSLLIGKYGIDYLCAKELLGGCFDCRRSWIGLGVPACMRDEALSPLNFEVRTLYL